MASFGDDRVDRVGTEIARYACRRRGRAAGITPQCLSIVCRIGIGTICAHLKCAKCGSVGWVDPRPNWSEVIDVNKRRLLNVSWLREFDDPIETRDRTTLNTLREAVAHLA